MKNWRLPYFSQIQRARRNSDGTATIFRHVKTEARKNEAGEIIEPSHFKNTEHTYPDIGRPINRASIINQSLMQRTR